MSEDRNKPTAPQTAPEARTEAPAPVSLPGLPGPSEAQPQGAVVTTDLGTVAQAEDADAGKKTYDTPWGRRKMGDTEAADLRAQGLEITEVDADPEVSLESEKQDLSKVQLRGTPKP